MRLKVDKKIFMWFLEKVKDLKPNEKEIKIGKYIFIFRYARVRIKLDEYYYDEVDFPAINPKATEDDLKNVILLVFDVKGLHKDYLTEIQISREDENQFEIYIAPDRQKNDIDDMLGLVSSS